MVRPPPDRQGSRKPGKTEAPIDAFDEGLQAVARAYRDAGDARDKAKEAGGC